MKQVNSCNMVHIAGLISNITVRHKVISNRSKIHSQRCSSITSSKINTVAGTRSRHSNITSNNNTAMISKHTTSSNTVLKSSSNIIYNNNINTISSKNTMLVLLITNSSTQGIRSPTIITTRTINNINNNTRKIRTMATNSRINSSHKILLRRQKTRW